MINTDKPNLLIPINKQSTVINEFSELRLDYYNNYPSTSVTIKNREITMGDFLNQIGRYFKKELFDSTFKPEPVNCFVVDKNTPIEALALVSLSLNLGAIQYIDPEEEVTKDGLMGRKFKLSYILYPSFYLPKRVNKPIALSKIIDSFPPKETALQGRFNF